MFQYCLNLSVGFTAYDGGDECGIHGAGAGLLFQQLTGTNEALLNLHFRNSLPLSTLQSKTGWRKNTAGANRLCPALSLDNLS
jgi:hypothetical protein